MYEYYFTFRSMTSAQNGILVLSALGIPAVFLRAPKRISGLGCGYAIKVQPSDGQAAFSALQKEGNAYERCVRIFSDGHMEEARF